jgi:heme-degrading monooxygenase HmoA
MHARIATYRYEGDARQLAKQAEQGMLPIFQKQPGFRAYSIAESDGEVISLSVWDTAEQIDAANSAASSWIQENLGDSLQLRDVRAGELLLSTTLSISP